MRKASAAPKVYHTSEPPVNRSGGPAHASCELPDTLNVEDVAACCCATTRTIRRWIKQGRIPRPFRIFGRLLWRRETIEQFLRDLEAAGAAEVRDE